MRIDAHQHFWKFAPDEYGWIVENGLEALRRDFGPADLRVQLDAHGIDGSIAVQARQSEAETEWLVGLSAEHPWIVGVVGWLDLRADGAPDDIARVRAKSDALVGLRHVIQDEAPGFMDDGAFRRGVAAAGRAGLVYDLLIFERQLEEGARFCAALDDQPIVLDHIAKPRIADGVIEPWSEGLGRLAAMEHVMVKVSGLVTEADHGAWTPEDLRPYLDRTLETFGPERLMFGSDWPVCTLAAPYGEVFDLVHEWAAPFTEAERAALFGGTAASTYGIRSSDV